MILRRFLLFFPLVLGMCMVSFFIMKLAPGDPSQIFFDPNMSPQDMAMIRHNMGLDRPIYVQFYFWFKEVLHGNLGYSYVTGRPVLSMILERLPATLILTVSNLCVVLLLTLPLGLIAGYKKNTWVDHTITFFSFLGLALPTFWVGLMLILFFSLTLGWFPSSGYMDPLLTGASFFSQAKDIVWHLILPLMAGVIGDLAALIRYNRFSVINILSQDFIKAGRARGLSEKRLLFKHAFKNAALPLVTILGTSLSGLLSGGFVIEYIFSWPGMGQLGVASAFARDYPVMMGLLLFSSILIVLGNLIADIVYYYVDPRVSV